MASIDAFLSAIMGQESGGNYRAVNRHTGALGLFQVLPSNVGPWARKYLGINLTPTQFLNNATMQRRLVTAVMSDYVRRYGYRGAASAWYSGNPGLANNYRPQKHGPSIGSYVDSVMGRMAAGTPAAGMIGAFNIGYKAVTQSLADNEKTLDPKQLGQPKGNPLEAALTPGTDGPIADLKGGLGLDSPLGPNDGEEAEPLGLAAPTGTQAAQQLTEHVPLANPLAQPRNGLTEPAVRMGGTVGGDGSIRNPLPGFKISFGYGQRYSSTRSAGDFHKGVDFRAPAGTRVMSPVSGRIVSAGWEKSGFGLAIRIQNSDGTYTILGHLSSIAGLRPGQVIKPGQFLGRVGSTGDSSGPHLHMEMRRSLYSINTAFDFSDSIEW